MEEPTTRPPAGFKAGRVRTGGRVRKSVAQAKAIAEKLQIDPLQVMLTWLSEGVYRATVIGPKGAEHKVKRPISFEGLLEVAKVTAGYLHARLSAVAVSGTGGGPIETSAVSATILMTPELSEAMQKIAFAAAEAEALECAARTIDAPYTATE
jgi:hypothetical protein